jgi:hypothetical protein
MENKEVKKKRTRSPGYPLIDLKEAITKALVLWEKDHQNSIPREVAYKHLGYESQGGYAGRVVSALKQFDLIIVKQGDIVLTQNAVDLALHDATDEEYKSILREIALKPAIYSKLYNEYNGSLPSDSTLRIRLVKEYGFNVDKVNGFLNTLHNTITFAGLTGLKEEKEIGKTEMGMDANLYKKLEQVVTPKTSISYNIPLKNQKIATLSFSYYPCKEDMVLIRKWLEILELSFPETQSTVTKDNESEEENNKTKEVSHGEE